MLGWPTTPLLGRLSAAFVLAAIVLIGCGPVRRSPSPLPPGDDVALAPLPEPQRLRVLSPLAPSHGSFAIRTTQALQRVAAARGLALLQPVRAEEIDQARALALVRENVARNMPAELLLAQGEMLRSLGLIPAAFDFADELIRFASSAFAGLYDPKRKTLFVLEHLRGPEAEHALLHESAHALHDQHFDLGARIALRPAPAASAAPVQGADGVTAQHAVIEGDATALTFLLQHGEVPDPEEMRAGMLDELRSRSDIPEVVRRSLVAPYCDGLAFVEQLRSAGGWPAVNDAWQRPPRSTEQLLHIEKYRSDEAPLTLPQTWPTAAGWTLLDSDVVGELGLRTMFMQWSDGATAKRAAAGWGGDRYMVMRRQHAAGEDDFWVSLLIAFDSEADAKEAYSVIRQGHPQGCRQSPSTGPLAHHRRGPVVGLVAGPYRRSVSGARAIAGADCTVAETWLSRSLARATRP